MTDENAEGQVATLFVNGEAIIEKKPISLVAKAFATFLQDVLGLKDGAMSVELQVHTGGGKLFYQRYEKKAGIADEVLPLFDTKDVEIDPIFRNEMTEEEARAAESVDRVVGPGQTQEGGGVMLPGETPEEFAARIAKGEKPAERAPTEKRKKLTRSEIEKMGVPLVQHPAPASMGVKVRTNREREDDIHYGENGAPLIEPDNSFDRPKEASDVRKRPLYTEAPEDESRE